MGWAEAIVGGFLDAGLWRAMLLILLGERSLPHPCVLGGSDGCWVDLQLLFYPKVSVKL